MTFRSSFIWFITDNKKNLNIHGTFRAEWEEEIERKKLSMLISKIFNILSPWLLTLGFSVFQSNAKQPVSRAGESILNHKKKTSLVYLTSKLRILPREMMIGWCYVWYILKHYRVTFSYYYYNFRNFESQLWEQQRWWCFDRTAWEV